MKLFGSWILQILELFEFVYVIGFLYIVGIYIYTYLNVEVESTLA